MIDPNVDPGEATRTPGRRRSLPASWPVAIVLIQAALVLGLGAWLLAGRAIGAPGAWAWAVKAKSVSGLATVRVLALGATIIALGGLGLQRIRARRRSDAPIVAGLVLLTFGLQLTVLGLAPDATFRLIAATASPVSTEYFDVAWNMPDPGDFVRDYPTEMRRGRHHVATHPPGAVLFYWLCIKLYQSPVFPQRTFERLIETVVGLPPDGIAAGVNAFPGTFLDPDAVGAALFCCLALGVCGALALVPVFHLTKAAAGRSTAVAVCMLFALSPAPVLFFQGLDSLLLLLVCGAVTLMLLALRRGSLPLAGVAGLLVGLGSLVSFGAAVAAGVVGLLVLMWALREGRDKAKSAWLALAVFGLGTAAVLLAGHIACGMKLHVIFRQGMAAHREFTWIGFRRAYSTWLVLNVVEFACFLGLPVCVAVLGGAWEAARRGWRGLSRADLVGLAGVTALIMLNLSGSVRGEVGRVWLFMMPLLVLWAGHWLSAAAPGRRALVFLTAALTLVQLVFLGVALTPVVMPF